MSGCRFIAILSLSVTGVALAAPKLNGAPVADPAKAYVVVEIENFESKVAGSTDSMPGVLSLARYDPAKQDIRGGNHAPESAVAPGEIVRTSVGGKPLIKEKTRRLYVFSLPPDVWVIEGAQATAFSLGSVMFRLEAGRTYDLGVFKPVTDWRPGETQGTSLGELMGAGLGGMFVKRRDPTPAMVTWHPRGPTDLAIPPEVLVRKPEQVVYEPGARFGNYLGGLVNRMGGRKSRFAAANENSDVQREGSAGVGGPP